MDFMTSGIKNYGTWQKKRSFFLNAFCQCVICRDFRVLSVSFKLPIFDLMHTVLLFTSQYLRCDMTKSFRVPQA